MTRDGTQVASMSAARPSGLVTFLFTDVERSTRQWEEAPEAMATALAQHDRILRAEIEARGGYIFSRAGDAVAAAFSTPVAAAKAAALAAQESLRAGSELRVRMGLHTGTAEERDDDYFGPTVNRTARLRDLGYGAQILCSRATADLLVDVDVGASLEDLGDHALKDLSRAEHVFELRPHGTTERFPPLRSVGDARLNLPQSTTPLIGREDDVEALAADIAQHRLVVLTGVGGVGKTRLAVEAARRAADSFPGGVFFVDLAPVAEPEQVASTTAAAIGLTDPAIAPTEQLAAWMSSSAALVVLDNCEHLVDACSDLVIGLLERGARGCILATTREAFGVEGEHTWQVASLTDDASHRLFESRAAAVRRGFVVDDRNRDAVTDICRRLDGIPLAIELAAARTAHLTPVQVAERLADRFKLLTGGRGRIQRQATLQATLDWSYDLLDERERALLRRLSVFNGDFSLEAVEGVCAGLPVDGTVVLDVLGSLVAQSLVVARDDGRYRLLETVRAYAEERLLHEGEAATWRSRHRDWYLAFVEGFDLTTSLFSEEVAASMAAELDNLVAAATWSSTEGRLDLMAREAVATSPMWRRVRLGAMELAHTWFDFLGERVHELEPDLALTTLALAVSASKTSMTGGTDDVARAADAFPDAHTTGPRALLFGHRSLRTAMGVTGGLSDDVALVDADIAAITRAHPGSDEWTIMGLAVATGALLLLERYEEAAALAEECHELSERLGASPNDVYSMYNAVGVVTSHLLGDAPSALTWADRGTSGGFLGMGAYWGLAQASNGHIDEGRAAILDTLDRITTWNIQSGETEAIVPLAAVEGLADRWERAATLLGAARQLGLRYLIPFRSPMTYVLYRHYNPLTRAHLGGQAARRARERGKAMSLAEVVAFAHEEI